MSEVQTIRMEKGAKEVTRGHVEIMIERVNNGWIVRPSFTSQIVSVDEIHVFVDVNYLANFIIEYFTPAKMKTDGGKSEQTGT